VASGTHKVRRQGGHRSAGTFLRSLRCSCGRCAGAVCRRCQIACDLLIEGLDCRCSRRPCDTARLLLKQVADGKTHEMTAEELEHIIRDGGRQIGEAAA
jgi:hypothetical protein